MDLITSVAKTASTPSLLLHKNAVYREELRRKKVYLEKSLYRALGKIKHEEHILKEKRAQSWDSSDSFQLRLPGFRFRANGDYKKSVSRMREERLWESLRGKTDLSSVYMYVHVRELVVDRFFFLFKQLIPLGRNFCNVAIQFLQ